METIKCITFDKEAQDLLPEHIKQRMKYNQEKAKNDKKTNVASNKGILQKTNKQNELAINKTN